MRGDDLEALLPSTRRCLDLDSQRYAPKPLFDVLHVWSPAIVDDDADAMRSSTYAAHYRKMSVSPYVAQNPYLVCACAAGDFGAQDLLDRPCVPSEPLVQTVDQVVERGERLFLHIHGPVPE